MKDYLTRKGFYLGWLVGGSIGAAVLWVMGHRWLAAECIIGAVLAAIFLGLEEKWHQE